jgi:hypothetical protein
MPLGSMGDPSGNCVVTLIIPSCILFKDRTPCSAFRDQVLALVLLYLFHPKKKINFEHFDMEGDSKKEVKMVINNTTTVKLN